MILTSIVAQFSLSCSRNRGWGKSEKAKSVAIKGRQKGELLERGGNVGDIVAGGKKGDTRPKLIFVNNFWGSKL